MSGGTMHGIARFSRLALAAAVLIGVQAQAQQHQSGNQGGGEEEGHHQKDNHSKLLVLQEQGSFYVGGQVKHTDATTGTPGGFLYPNEDDILVNQMYVQYQVPVGHE